MRLVERFRFIDLNPEVSMPPKTWILYRDPIVTDHESDLYLSWPLLPHLSSYLSDSIMIAPDFWVLHICFNSPVLSFLSESHL